MRGGKPGYYPSLKDASSENGGVVPHPVPFDLFLPFGPLFGEQTAEQKERGRNVEINNGRLAQLGIIGLISASKGLQVPGLDSIEGVGRYSGVYMQPFDTDDTGLWFVGDMLKSVPDLASIFADYGAAN